MEGAIHRMLEGVDGRILYCLLPLQSASKLVNVVNTEEKVCNYFNDCFQDASNGSVICHSTFYGSGTG